MHSQTITQRRAFTTLFLSLQLAAHPGLWLCVRTWVPTCLVCQAFVLRTIQTPLIHCSHDAVDLFQYRIPRRLHRRRAALPTLLALAHDGVGTCLLTRRSSDDVTWMIHCWPCWSMRRRRRKVGRQSPSAHGRLAYCQVCRQHGCTALRRRLPVTTDLLTWTISSSVYRSTRLRDLTPLCGATSALPTLR